MAKTTAEILTLLCQNAAEVIDKGELEARLIESAKEKRPLRIKAGFDPSAPDIHLGHTVLLRKLRQFQDLGHKVIFIIGDYTAMIGDPTGKIQTRPALSSEEVEKNSKTYQNQVFKILDGDRGKIEIVRNSSWFMKPEMFGLFLAQVCTNYTLAQILERDDFQKRMSQGQPITIREFLYPLLQGYDSVQVKADVELGGTDQKFNLLVGRNLQRAFGQRPQIVMTMPLLVGLDGSQKMSKSLNNYVATNDSSKDMFGKIMSIPDPLMEPYFKLLTDEVSWAKLKAYQQEGYHPRLAKKDLAFQIVAYYYGDEIAHKESEEFDRVFRDRQNPEAPEEIRVSSKSLWIVDLIKATGSVKTSQDARRLIEQGAVELSGSKISDPKAQVEIRNGCLLKLGKKKFFKLIV